MMWIVLIVLVIGLTIGVFSTLRLIDWRPQTRRSAQVEDRTIVTLTGTVRIVGEPLIAPLSARRCVMYESYANLYETVPVDPSRSDDKRTLVAQLAKRAMVPFELETTIGVVVIDGTEADLELVPTPVFPRRPEREMAFLREHDRDPALADTTGFEEISVDPDSLISVRGMAMVASPTEVRLVAHEGQALVIGTPRSTTVRRDE